MTIDHPPTLGLVLAGGLARRMGGGDKALIDIDGVTILERVLMRLRPQCTGLVLNANGDPRRFAAYGLPVIPDDVPDFAGPLAGILAALDWAAANVPAIEWVVSVPGDCRHPVVGLWPVSLRADLRHALVKEGLHKIEVWTSRHGAAIAEWPDRPVDPFFNVNTPEDRDRAAAIAAHNRDA